MPASGRGANLDLTRRIGAPRPSKPAYHPPMVYAPPAPHRSLTGLPSNPFAHAQHQAAARVTHAQLAQPKRPTPYLPVLAHPTPQQTKAALNVVRSHQRSTGLKPLDYWRELRADPRNAPYLRAVEHYAGISQREAAGAEATGQQRQVPMTEYQAPSRGGGLLGLLPATVRNYLGERVAEDAPALAAVGSAGLKLALGSTGGEVAPNRPIWENAAIDLAQLPRSTISSLVQTGAAGVSALKGDTKPAGAILKGLAETVEHPVRSLETRPVTTALVLAGQEEAAGKLLGGAMRHLPSEALKAAASTDRAPLELYNGLRRKQTYSSAVTRKAAQVLTEKAKTSERVPAAYRRPATNLASYKELHRAIVGGVTRPGEVDVSHAGGEQMRRNLRSSAMLELARAKPKHGAAAVPLIAERIVTHPDRVASDLEKEATRLADVQHELKGADLARNRENLAEVEGLLKDHKFLQDPHEAFHAAEVYRGMTGGQTRMLQQVGHFSGAQVDRAPLFPYAMAHMDARYLTVKDHAALERQWRGIEGAARQRAKAAAPGSAERAQALTDAREARAHRYAVSGRRAPEWIAAHEQTIEAHKTARVAVTAARADLRSAERAHDRLVGARGRPRPGQDAAVAGYGSRVDAAKARVGGARDRLRLAEREARDARDAAESSRLPRQKAGLRKSTGEYLSNEEILGHMRANGVEPPAFLSHEPRLLGRGSFFQSTTRRPGIARAARTGESLRKGTYQRGYGALVAEASKLANLYAAHHATDERLSRFGVGSYKDEARAHEALAEFAHTPEGERIEHSLGPLQAVPIGPERVRAAGNVHPGSVEAAHERFGIEPHGDGVPQASGPEARFTLLPEMVAQRLAEHDKLLGSPAGRKFLQKVTSQWRQTALFTSPRWLLGSPQEHGVRLAMAGAAPKFLGGRSGRFGGRVAKAWDEIAMEHGMDAQAAQLAHAKVIKGTLYGSTEDQRLYRAADQFQSSAIMGPPLAQAERVKDARAGRVALAPWRKWHQVVSNGMVKLERESRQAALGRAAIKEVHGFTGHWRNVMRMTDEQVKAYARGALKPEETAHLVKEVDEMMGAYGHLTPTVRSAVQTWSPFGLWWLTSMRYLRRLPLDHPTKTAVLAALHNAIGPQEKQASELPYLQGGVHVNLPLGLGGATLGPLYYTPAGTSIEPLKTAADMVAPFETELLGGALGLDTFRGKPLEAPHTAANAKGEVSEGERPKVLLSDLLGGLVPGYRQALQLREKGGTPYSTSNLLSPKVKPGSERGLAHTLVKVLSPARMTYDRGERGTGGAAATPEERAREGVARQREVLQEALAAARRKARGE